MQILRFITSPNDTPNIGENVYNTIANQIGASVELPLATMIEIAGGDVNMPAANHQRFSAYFKHYLQQISCPGKVMHKRN